MLLSRSGLKRDGPAGPLEVALPKPQARTTRQATAGPGSSFIQQRSSISRAEPHRTKKRSEKRTTPPGRAPRCRDFLNQVSAQTGKKLTEEQAEELTDAANEIRELLDC